MELQSWWGTSTMTGMTDNLFAIYKEGRNKNIKQPPTINKYLLLEKNFTISSRNQYLEK